MKTTINLFAFMLMTIAAVSQNITFNSNELYPEGIAYSHKLKTFFASSIHYGKVGKVDEKGNYAPFVDDAELVSSLGLLADDKRNLLYVCIADPGVSIKTKKETQGKLGKIAAYDLTTGKRKFMADLGALNTTGGNFANDIALDEQGNLYITNSFSPIIFKVDQTGKASIFATSDLWKGEGFNLNGIAYHAGGYLLVDQSNTGNIYKVSIKDPKNVSQVKVNALAGADGLILGNEKELIVISNSSQKAFRVTSNDNWQSATVAGEVATVLSFPTTGVKANKKYYVLNAKLNEIFDPNAVKTSNFVLQQVGF